MYRLFPTSMACLAMLSLAACPAPDDTGSDTSDTSDTDTTCTPNADNPEADSDGDLLSDADEAERGTEACVRDSDGDGVSDGVEVNNGSDPLNELSVPDGTWLELSDGGTELLELSFLIEIGRADVAFLIDTSQSMGPTASAMASEFASIVSELSVTIPNATYGLATYEDFAFGAYGEATHGDKPFVLLQQQTSDISLVADALNTKVEIHLGGDEPESTIEALYQGLKGFGYDQGGEQGGSRCGQYDPSRDVLPFKSLPGDVFEGNSAETAVSSTPGTGTQGGFGFRRGSLPILIYATDALLRDPDSGYGVPPTCGARPAAGTSDVVAAVRSIGGRLIGINVTGAPGPRAQMEALAFATGSVGDIDGNTVLDPFVFDWAGADTAGFRTTVVDAVAMVVGALSFEKVGLDYEGSGAAFVSTVSPQWYNDIGVNDFDEPLVFTVAFDGVSPALGQDQVFDVVFTLMGDDAVALGQRHVHIVVPGIGVD